ncbi:unnamed protein product [Microthlaspi erraticum]|uniref:Uncharacterized protein n=1 Tax=Microthlaspi erraticum TaxID=1685480 RepID=A0A6D2JEY7_9BRAS|nr:unnamed protein product [Microthlaspi erraticum]
MDIQARGSGHVALSSIDVESGFTKLLELCKCTDRGRLLWFSLQENRRVATEIATKSKVVAKLRRICDYVATLEIVVANSSQICDDKGGPANPSQFCEDSDNSRKSVAQLRRHYNTMCSSQNCEKIAMHL